MIGKDQRSNGRGKNQLKMGEKEEEDKWTNLRCVNCGVEAPSLYRRFSKEIIRLTPCVSCYPIHNHFIHLPQPILHL